MTSPNKTMVCDDQKRILPYIYRTRQSCVALPQDFSMTIDPNIDDMTAHLALLFDWTQTEYPTHCSRYAASTERWLASKTNASLARQMAINRPTDYAVQHNDQGYNIYTTVNPLKPERRTRRLTETWRSPSTNSLMRMASLIQRPDHRTRSRLRADIHRSHRLHPIATLSGLLAAERADHRHGGMEQHTGGTGAAASAPIPR